MKEQNVTVGDRDFMFFELKPFDAVKHGMRLKNILASGFSNLDSNVGELVSGLDEHTLDKVIFPILTDCAVVCTSAKCKLQDAKGMNEIYTIDDLDEFFELVGIVLKVNFGPLVKKTLLRFGVDPDKLDLEKVKQALKEKAKTLQK